MPRDLSLVEIEQYLEQLVPERPEELRAMEAEARRTDFPIIGAAAGQCCHLLARLAGARRIFELGSGFGYSTAWFARAVRENGGGVVHHAVWDAELSARARTHLERLGFGDLIEYHVGEAVAALRTTDGRFDLIFNDIDKEGYPAALEVIEARLRPGGLLITDNLLWHGRALDPTDRSPATAGIREFTRRITTDPRWVATIIPIRDGLLAAQWHP